MVTFKQIEALYWIAQLGSFERAAQKLNATQSTISKRIHDLEMISSSALFDRSKRSARLTLHGEEILRIGQDMLRLRDQMGVLMKTTDLPQRHFRLGVTELTALTWLPTLLTSIRSTYPELDLTPEVESSKTLHERLQQGKVDMIVIPDITPATNFKSTPLGQVNNVWMSSPDLLIPRGIIDLKILEDWTVLAQNERSGTGSIYQKWLTERGVSPKWSIASNSLIALMGLIVSGAGVGYLPKEATKMLLSKGKLQEIKTKPALPSIVYVAMFPDTITSSLESFVLKEMRQCCDFTKPIFRGKSTAHK